MMCANGGGNDQVRSDPMVSRTKDATRRLRGSRSAAFDILMAGSSARREDVVEKTVNDAEKEERAPESIDSPSG